MNNRSATTTVVSPQGQRIGAVHSRRYWRLPAGWVLGCIALLGMPAPAGAQAPLFPDPPSERNAVVIPFDYDPLTAPVPIVRLRINGKKPLPFIVDTGSNVPLLLDVATAKALGLTAALSSDAAGGGGLTRVPVASVGLVRAGSEPDVRVGLDVVFVADLKGVTEDVGTARPVGIIGTPLLEQAGAVSFDFAAKTLTLFARAHPPLRSVVGTATTVPLVRRNGLYFARITPAAGTSVDLLVDTGSDATSLPVSVASRLLPQATVTDIYAAMDGVYFLDRLLLPRLKVGDFDEANVAVFSAPDNAEGKLGMNLLSRFRVVLDFAAEVAVLEYPQDYAGRIWLEGWTGIRLTAHGEAFVVESVAAGSAATAGVHQGDQVLTVDGQDLQGMSLTTARTLLQGLAGNVAVLRLRSAGGTASIRTVTFKRQSEFDSPSYPRLGLSLKATPGALVVAGVTATSPAYRSGVRAGDAVTALNGLPVTTASLEQIQEQLRKPEVIFTVQRPAERKPRSFRFRTRQP